jgi:phosphatidylserine/phosphatidylglycerophosphate/cardiolipin synthase-like enzyme
MGVGEGVVAVMLTVKCPLPMLNGQPYRERHAYGPGTSGFHAELGIEVDADFQRTMRAVAMTAGFMWCFGDPGDRTCTIMVLPSHGAPALATITGDAIGIVYRHLDRADLIARWGAKIKAGPDPRGAGEPRLARFLAGETGQPVAAGDAIALCATPGPGTGNGHLGLEIVFVPKAAGAFDERPALLRRLLDVKEQTRRIDPAAFLWAVRRGNPQVELDRDQIQHPLFNVMTRRVLLEIRDEHDLPFAGALIVDGTSHSLDPAQWSTLQILALPRGEEPQPLEVRFRADKRICAPLPSGKSEQEVRWPVLAPAHLAAQCIYMHDSDDPSQWFAKPQSAQMRRFTGNNEVKVLADGLPTFKDMLVELGQVNQPEHELRLSGWWMDLRFKLTDEGVVRRTMGECMEVVVAHGGRVLCLPWEQAKAKVTYPTQDGDRDFKFESEGHKKSVDAVTFVNGLTRDGRAHGVVDGVTRPLTESVRSWLGVEVETKIGAHHQKFMILKGTQGPIAYCGGIDINADRLDDPEHDRGLRAMPITPGSYHDVHTRVIGPAVVDLDRTFVERWRRAGGTPVAPLAINEPEEPRRRPHFVQISRTYPARVYPDLPQGEQGTLHALLAAIRRARHFIYIEDQYLTPYPGKLPFTPSQDTIGITTALVEALQRVKFLLAVIPNYSDQPEGRLRRLRFITALKAAAPDKVHIYYLKRNRKRRRDDRPGQDFAAASVVGVADHQIESHLIPRIPPEIRQNLMKLRKLYHRASGSQARPNEIFVHTKAWMIDDVYVKVGSANVNRRGFTFDSELDVHVIDGEVSAGKRAFALAARRAIWGEHLRVLPAQVPDDPRSALALWRERAARRGARIAKYDETIDTQHDVPEDLVDKLWDIIVDPEGR